MAKYKLFLVLVDLTDKFVHSNNTKHVLNHVYLYKSEVNDRIETRKRRDELRLFCYYKVLKLRKKENTVI